jgi:hypothetical protein
VHSVLAHAAGGHWLIDFGIYLGPLFVIFGAVMISDRRRRRREGAEGGATEAPSGE